MANRDVPHLDQVLEEGNLRAGVAEVLKILKPNWDAEKVILKDMSMGYANKNYAILNGTAGLFLRLINPNMPGFLEGAINSMRYLKRRQIGAQLLLTFKNGLVMELLDGKGISWEEFYLVKEPATWRGLAREIARYHGTTNVDDIKELNIMDTKGFVDSFRPQMLTIEDKLKEFNLPNVDEITALRNEVYNSLVKDGAQLGFCHLDANPTNVLLTADKGPILIDYDMCVHDLCVVNLANIFCSVTNIAMWSFDDQPTDEEKSIFIREYLKARSEIEPGFGNVDENIVNQWTFMVEKAHLCFYLYAIGAVLLMQTAATKPIDISLSKKFWEKYRENEKLVQTNYQKK